MKAFETHMRTVADVLNPEGLSVPLAYDARYKKRINSKNPST